MHNFEHLGFIPRSIVRTIQRFFKQIGLKTDLFVIYEFRVSRYIAIASFQCFFSLILCPWIFQFFIKFFFTNILFEHNSINNSIFINYTQQERAFSKIQTFSQKIYFETLLNCSKKKYLNFKPNIFIRPKNKELNLVDLNNFEFNQQIYQNYYLECAYYYNKQSIFIVINWIIDILTLIFFSLLLYFSTSQILILKTFFIESLLNLSETTKCFFLIFFLDLLVGFHSSKSWEIFLQFFIDHYGFQFYQNQNFVAFFISTFPVLFDTIFKYLIFRYLNKISPSTVATYQAMIE